MRAFGTAGGGVMFVADEIANIPPAKTRCPVANEIKMMAPAESAVKEKKLSLFGRRRKIVTGHSVSEAA